MLQDWPDGSPLTLHTLASLMISKSDNTATDVLLDFVGRTSVEKLAPGNAPFLSTREAFILKAKSNAPLLARFRSGDEAARRKILTEIAKTKPTTDFGAEPTALDVEWMFSARRLCELLAKNKDLDALHINPGLAKPKTWSKVAYKGGSEPGVLNFSSWVEKGAQKHCVVTTWNDETKALDEDRLATLHGLLLVALAGGK
jgi:beta-lactamase class A